MRSPFYFLNSFVAWAFFGAILWSLYPAQIRVLAEDQENLGDSDIETEILGSDTPAHWAFKQLPARESQQTLTPQQWAELIDAFLDAGLHAAGLEPNPPANRNALLRRVCLDLTGLPPSADFRKAFLGNQSDDAYEELVDKLLTLPSFGIHQAHYWLDLVRYADTHGLHIDNHREIWMYRDYVIDSFNQNKPFDQFLTEQLAGDLLESRDLRVRREQQVATGLLRLNLTTNEAGSIYEEVFAKNLFDLTDAFGTIFLGLTTQCAACHDHKSDPMTQQDYYSLAAFFNNLDGNAMDNNDRSPAPTIALPTLDEESKLRRWQERIAEIDEEMQKPQAAIDEAQHLWEQAFTEKSSQASPDLDVAVSPWSMCGPFDTETIEFAYEKPFASIGKPFDAQESFRYRDSNFSWRPIGITLDGLWTELPAIENRQSVIVLHADLSSPNATQISLNIAGKDGVQIFLNGSTLFDLNGGARFLPRHDRVALPLVKGANELYIKVVSHRGPSRISFSINETWAVPDAIRRIIATPIGSRTADEVSQLRIYYRRVWCDHPDYIAMQDEQAGTINQLEGLLKVLPTAMVYRERTSIRPQHVFKGGRYDALGEEVTRNTPAFLPPLRIEAEPHVWHAGKRSANRIDLAHWVTSDENPLTARAAVNRFWQSFFGRGLVETSEDLGVAGAPPSHPQLLNELASEFRRDWNIKRLFKAIVMTRAYQRDAAATETKRSIDPENRWLARGPRNRLDAEVIRDQALVLAGLLNAKMQGPSSKPPQPAGLWEAVGHSRSNTVSYFADRDANIYRRTIYTFWKRTSPPPWTSILDAPTRETCRARREQTNTPSQALMLMNEPQYQEAATELAKLTIEQSKPLQSSIRWLFEHVVGREPTTSETTEIAQFFESQVQSADENADANAENKSTMPLGSDASELAAWSLIASMLLNLDEVLCK